MTTSSGPSVALVTGAGRGIGAATARCLARTGSAVAVNYHRHRAAGERVALDIEAGGGTALAVQADVTDPGEVRKMVERVEHDLGPIEVLVCNAAGVSDPAFGTVLDISAEAVERLVVRQLRAVLLPTRAVVPGMTARGSGAIVVVSSGLARSPKPGRVALSIAKGAIEAAARGLAVELGPRGVRVNVVAPGPTLTDAAAWASADVRREWAERAPLRRNALAEDVAGPIAFLLSDAARFVTGAHLAADGGVVMP